MGTRNERIFIGKDLDHMKCCTSMGAFNAVRSINIFHMHCGGLTSWAEKSRTILSSRSRHPDLHSELLKNVGEEPVLLHDSVGPGQKIGDGHVQFPGSFRANRQELENFLP